MKMFDHDPIDRYLHRLMKNWVNQVPLPVNGKDDLYFQARHNMTVVPASRRVFQFSFWIMRNLILIPLDYILSPMLYSAEDEIHTLIFRSRLDLSLAVRAMTNDTLSHGMEIFTYIT